MLPNPPVCISVGESITLRLSGFELSIFGNPAGFIEISAIIDQIPFKDAVTAKISRKTKFNSRTRGSECKIKHEYTGQVKVANRPPKGELSDSERIAAMKLQGHALVAISDIADQLVTSTSTLENFFADYDLVQKNHRQSKNPTPSHITKNKPLLAEAVKEVVCEQTKKTPLGSRKKITIKTASIHSTCELQISKMPFGVVVYHLNQERFMTASGLLSRIMLLTPTEFSTDAVIDLIDTNSEEH